MPTKREYSAEAQGSDLMSDRKRGRAATLDWLADPVTDIKCVDLRSLPPFTTVLVGTVNSVYRVVTTCGPDVSVQGGVFFPEATWAHLEGASIGGSCLRAGCICVGMLIEIRSSDRRIITSAVLAIRTVQASGSFVH